MVFLVIADVRSKDVIVRERLDAEIKKMGNWSSRFPNAWMLETADLGARKIRDRLAAHLQDSDRLFVARISRNWAGRNMGEGFAEWMQRRDYGDFPNG